MEPVELKDFVDNEVALQCMMFRGYVACVSNRYGCSHLSSLVLLILILIISINRPILLDSVGAVRGSCRQSNRTIVQSYVQVIDQYGRIYTVDRLIVI